MNMDTLALDEKRAKRLSAEVLDNLDTDPRQDYAQLERYLRELRYYQVMKHEETLQCLAAWKNHGDREAYARMMYCNHRMVLSVAVRLVGLGLPLLDMLQEGFLGLMTAIDKFKPELGYQFITYAMWWIRQAITRAIMDYGEKKPYRIPVHIAEKTQYIHRAIERFFEKHGWWPNDQETYDWVQSMVGTEEETKNARTITLDEVVACRRLIARGHYSLDYVYDNKGQKTDLHDIVSDVQVDVETMAEAQAMLVEYEAALTRIESEVDAFDPRSAMVVRLRFGLGEFDAMTLEQTAERYELTRERIRQIEAAALKQLASTLGVSGEDLEKIVAVVDELRKIVSAPPVEKTAATGQAQLPASVSLEHLFGLLCEHVLLTPTGMRVVKAPLTTLQARGHLIYDEALSALEQLQARGLIVGDSHWTLAEVIPEVAIPEFRRYSSRGPNSRGGSVDGDGEGIQAESMVGQPATLPRERAWVTRRTRHVHPQQAERSTTVRRRAGNALCRLTYRQVSAALAARASVVSGEQVIRGAVPLLEMSFKINASDATRVLEKLKEQGYITQKDGWRVILLGQNRADRDAPVLAANESAPAVEPARPVQLTMVPGGAPVLTGLEMSASKHAILDTAINWIERQLPQLRQALGEAHSRLGKLEQALVILKQARDGHEQTAVAVNQAIAEMEAAMQEFFVLLRQGNSA